jgi:glutathione S-transferase
VLRLITIPISHYCEKARWALDRAGLRYREERHVQGIHRFASRRAGGQGTVPVLVAPGAVVADSAEIVEWVDERTAPERRLLPPDPDAREQARALCRRLDERLGPHGRRLIYVHMFARDEQDLSFNNAGVPAWEGLALRWGFPLAKRFVGHALGIRPGVAAEDERAVWGELDFVASLLDDGRPHLCGERFGAADLTFAALAAAVVLPPVYGTPLPQPENLPPATAALVRSVRAHPAGAYAMRMFAEQRRANALA